MRLPESNGKLDERIAEYKESFEATSAFLYHKTLRKRT